MTRVVHVSFASDIDGDRQMFLHPSEDWWGWRVEVRRTPEGPFTDAVLVEDQFIGWAGRPLPGQGCWYVDWGQVARIVLDDGSTAEVEVNTTRTESGDAACPACTTRRVAVDSEGHVLGHDHTRMTWQSATSAESAGCALRASASRIARRRLRRWTSPNIMMGRRSRTPQTDPSWRGRRPSGRT